MKIPDGRAGSESWVDREIGLFQSNFSFVHLLPEKSPLLSEVHAKAMPRFSNYLLSILGFACHEMSISVLPNLPTDDCNILGFDEVNVWSFWGACSTRQIFENPPGPHSQGFSLRIITWHSQIQTFLQIWDTLEERNLLGETPHTDLTLRGVSSITPTTFLGKKNPKKQEKVIFYMFHPYLFGTFLEYSLNQFFKSYLLL